jgi:hypothetical protein
MEKRQDSIVNPITKKIPFFTLKFLGPAALLAVIIIICISIYFNNEAKETIKTSVVEAFQTIYTDISSAYAKPVITGAPEVFLKNLKTTPGNCYPYAGCFYPSKFANPENLNTGERDSVPDDEIWCEKAWRDCNTYQNCVDGKCVHKPNII